MVRARLFQLVAVALLLAGPGTAVADTNKSGEVVGGLLPLSALLAAWLYEDGNEGLWQLGRSAVSAELTTVLLKQVIDKERPSGNCCTAFPSGHATRAFYSAAFLDRRYGRRAGVPAYLAATFVAYSRVESKHHDEADVIAGAAIGWLSSRYFTTRHEGIRIMPTVGSDSVGLVIEVDL